MRRALLVACAALVAAQASSGGQQPLQPAAPAAPDTRRPIIVPALNPVAPPPLAPAASQPSGGVGAPAVPDRPQELVKLEDTIKKHQESLEAISKQLEEGLKQKKRLVVAQKLLEAIIHLKKAERLMAELDARVEAAKANIKKFGEQADEITESIKSSEVAHRKELADLNKKLDDLRTNLGEQEKTLAGLVNKRSRIAATVSKWKDHVATLHDVHEALAQPAGAPTRRGAEDEFPEPPPAGGVLRDIGFDSLSGLDARDSAFTTPTLTGTMLDAAAAEVAKRTFQELGQGRFAAAGGAKAGATLRGAMAAGAHSHAMAQEAELEGMGGMEGDE